MQIKEWNEYTGDEKSSLLTHWFHYYGKLLYTLDELEKFQDLTKKDSNKMFSAAVACYISGGNSSLLLTGLRQDGEKFIDVAGNRGGDLRDKNEEEYEAIASSFIEEIVTTYNNPKPDIPLTEEELLRQLGDIFEKKELTGRHVEEVFRDCLFKEDELEDNKPTEDFTIATGVSCTAAFNTERLNQYKGTINNMLDEVYGIETGTPFTNLCLRKNGNLWTGDQSTMDKLMILGFATELLEVPYNIPREKWREIFDDGMPVVIENNEKVDTPVVGTPKENYDETTKRYRKNN